jgi:chaperonin GroEL
MSHAGDKFKTGLDAQQSLQLGLALLERTLGSTLGPLGSPVIVSRIGRPNEPPEVLSDAGILALRLTGIPEPYANVGFMLNRQVAWKLHTEMGDGSATASVICGAAHRALLTAVVAGAEPHCLRRGVARAVQLASMAIIEAAEPLSAPAAQRLVASTCQDARLVPIITDAVAVLGPDGVITVKDSPRDHPELQIVEGSLWESGLVSSHFTGSDMGAQIRVAHPHVLIWNASLDEIGPVVDALGQLRHSDVRCLLIVARSFNAEVMSLLDANNKPGFQLFPVSAPYEGTNQEWALSDLAVLTGARVLGPDRGDTLRRLDLRDLGWAERATIGSDFFNVLPFEGPSEAVERQAASVRYLLSESEKESERAALSGRLGRLAGGMGVVWVGGHNEEERVERRQGTERTIASLRAASEGGIVPGSGAMYLAVSRNLSATATKDDDPGMAAIATALAAPAWWIARNAGLDAEAALAAARPVAPGQGIDGVTGALIDLRRAGVMDPALILVRALAVGATAAAMAITGEVLVARPHLRITEVDIRP